MSDAINREKLAHLAKLARIDLDPAEEDKFLRDLARILEYVEEMNSVATDQVAPMTGGTSLRNAFRPDEARLGTNQGKGKDAFPAGQKGLLKVPPVFE